MGSREYTGRSAKPGTNRLIGVNPVLEQLRLDPTRIRRIQLARGSSGAARVLAAAAGLGVPVEEVAPQQIRKEVGSYGQGVVADVKEFRYAALEDLTGGCLVAADQVTDPRNLGALVRSAEALGASGLILPAHRTARVTAVVEKAAAGATSSLPIAIVGNLAGALERLKRWDYWVVGLDAGAEIAIQDFEFPQKIVLVVGSEGEGMRYRTRALCDFRVAIPLTGRVTSLNVSAAGAIAVFCHHTYRQRIDSSPPG